MLMVANAQRVHDHQQYESNPTAEDHHGANPSRRDYASRPDRVAHPVVDQL